MKLRSIVAVVVGLAVAIVLHSVLRPYVISERDSGAPDLIISLAYMFGIPALMLALLRTIRRKGISEAGIDGWETVALLLYLAWVLLRGLVIG